MNEINFEKKIEVRWSDVDQNRHVRHSAYYDFGAHVRIRFFSEMGYGGDKMNKLNIGPIIFKEQCSFIREISLDDTIIINLLKGEINEDASRWTLHHEILGLDRVKKAHLTIEGAWIDLHKRKLTVPPSPLAKAFNNLKEGQSYKYSKN